MHKDIVLSKRRPIVVLGVGLASWKSPNGALWYEELKDNDGETVRLTKLVGLDIVDLPSGACGIQVTLLGLLVSLFWLY